MSEETSPVAPNVFDRTELRVAVENNISKCSTFGNRFIHDPNNIRKIDDSKLDKYSKFCQYLNDKIYQAMTDVKNNKDYHQTLSRAKHTRKNYKSKTPRKKIKSQGREVLCLAKQSMAIHIDYATLRICVYHPNDGTIDNITNKAIQDEIQIQHSRYYDHVPLLKDIGEIRAKTIYRKDKKTGEPRCIGEVKTVTSIFFTNIGVPLFRLKRHCDWATKQRKYIDCVIDSEKLANDKKSSEKSIEPSESQLIIHTEKSKIKAILDKIIHNTS